MVLERTRQWRGVGATCTVPAELKLENTFWAFAQTAMACAIRLLAENLMLGVVLFHTRQAKELLAKVAGLKFDLSFTPCFSLGECAKCI